MKRMIFILSLLAAVSVNTGAQTQPDDSLNTYMDSILRELPEVMITGERPVVKAVQGKLEYDLPRLVKDRAVDNAYDAIKELPGVIDQGEGLTLAGQAVTVVLDGKISTLTVEQLNNLLKSMPVGRIAKAEVMYSAPARYQVRGPMINIVLKSGAGNAPSLQGELYTSYTQQHYGHLSERASFLFSSPKFSADLLYSYNYDRGWSGEDKTALHTLADGSVYEMDLVTRSNSRKNRHNIRLGMDYYFTKEDALSLVYTTQWMNGMNDSQTRGTQNSTTLSHSDDWLHNVKLDYRGAFGLKAGSEFTFYEAPLRQLLHSKMGEEELNFISKDQQRINKWRFYLGQEHSLPADWTVNYGVNYTTSLDNSFQFYYNPQTGDLLPEPQMKARRREQTLNIYAGFGKNFGEKLSMDASVAAEQYHSVAWKEWSVFPTFNLNYNLAPGHLLQFSLSSNKEYPGFWSMQDITSYISAYSEIQGNPLLKPSSDYNASLTYIWMSKYVFTAYFDHTKNDFKQTLYQSPERLVEIYKFFNFDYAQQAGLQVTIPFRVKKWLDSRVTLYGLYNRQKDSDFWDIPFDRKLYTFVAFMNHTFTLSSTPNLKLMLNGFYQNRAIQGIYDIPASGNIDVALRYTFVGDKAQLTLKCDDLFNTSTLHSRIRFGTQYVSNNYLKDKRAFGISFSYKFGGYKEKSREGVDTSRFK